MKKFNVDKFLEAEDTLEWYRVPSDLIENLKLNTEELNFTKKLYAGYFVKNYEVNIPAERILLIIREINEQLMYESDNYYVFILPGGFRIYHIAGDNLVQIFEDSVYEKYMEEVK